ncbi:AraC family transcriptional regulator [Amycolatopsis sp., V23-08]|uniref:AraC family transcriptional regulator n=1 Tax=Amycolatopsis heterodermiae TaxID=3110235 RepID=A0ABU5R301_9PSEU|nr:AraC family transcriptional regulator [Amycolatopsis sp., V23-08]MEA5360543.1 AraC family transcriptional regulator [Amycolatopsis sp., V23-08]
MDGVSRLVRLARLEGGVDVRCLLAGRFALDHPAAAPGEVPFHLVLDGRCTVTSGATSVELGPGDMVLLPHGGAHTVSAASGRRRRFEEEPGAVFPTRRTVGAEPELDLFCGHYRFEPGAGALLFRLLPPLVHVSLDAPACTLAGVLRGEAGVDGPGTGAIVAALCDALLAMALRSRPEQRLGEPALWTAMGDDVLGRVIAGIVDDPGEAWTIDRLAAAASMSRATFVRRFTARTGTTVATLVTAIRMMVAADLLTRSDHSVSRVASDVGYRSESAFGQAFHAALGTSPGRFRREALRVV